MRLWDGQGEGAGWGQDALYGHDGQSPCACIVPEEGMGLLNLVFFLFFLPVLLLCILVSSENFLSHCTWQTSYHSSWEVFFFCVHLGQSEIFIFF